MKKKILTITLLFSLTVAVCACGKESAPESTTENAVRKDVVEFVSEELPAIKGQRDSAIGIYNSYFANETPDVEAFKESLKNDAIPGMEKYLESLNAIETSTEQVGELKSIYCQSAQRQYDAMKMVLSALEGENADYLTQAQNLVNESDEFMKQYKDKLDSIAKDNDITINYN